MSDFGALSVALSGLYAAQRGLDVTGQNLANVNTEGYSRQRMEQSARTGPKVPAIFATWHGGGDGVNVDGISRFRETLLEIQGYVAHAASASLDETKAALAAIEDMFNEPSDTGIQSQLSAFWSSWNDVANMPSDLASRSQLVLRASTLTSSFNAADASLDTMKQQTLDQLEANVSQVNAISANIASLNATIQTAAVANLPHNELLDQRDVLINQLSSLVGVTTRHNETGVVDVMIGGNFLVSGVYSFAIEGGISGPNTTINWAATGFNANATGGSIGGQLTTVNDLIPRYKAGLDSLAVQLANSVNSVHTAVRGTIAVGSQNLTALGSLQFGLSVGGVAYPNVSVTGSDFSGVGGAAALQSALQTALDTATGSAGVAVATVTGGNGTPLRIAIDPGTSGQALTVSGVGANVGLVTLLGDTPLGLDGIGGRAFFSGTNAETLAVDPALIGNPSALGAGKASLGANDGSWALALSALTSSPTGPDASYRAYIVGLGVEANDVNNRARTQATLTSSIDSTRTAQAGVNIDEEMINMTAYQHAYQAAARYMTTIDEMLDTLVNRTGLIGR